VPVVRFVNARSPDAPLAAAFRRDLNEAGYLRTIQVCLNDLPAMLWQAKAKEFARLTVVAKSLRHSRQYRKLQRG